MELFNYENVGFLTKYSNYLYWGCLALTAVVFFALVLVATGKYGFFKKLLWFVIACATAAVLFVGSGWLRNYTAAANDVYNRYKEAYEKGEVHIVSGQVKDFTPAQHSKSFTLDEVKFTVYSATSGVHSSGKPILYYVYTEGGYSYSGAAEQWFYKPEQCVILGENQRLEIHYVEEDGENHILYIKELSE